ncbi:UDP-N-acetylmuramate--L-alanine ligase [Atopobacter sp. AH10]|uniref:UDP-N-acetylmuramate--L-alanine ligase n=1 Tax=Atopobacter sp. AH10 TaxID=2315861 RepID=UPI000EF2903D|nr:UDP-N-acetylmuramate--L-alanine ligase [Atopobacter sp. AH10]RLK64132.1 UDP-N-acetylmuramate--L-alanine ligase [Atopobacter sp. AH10]
MTEKKYHLIGIKGTGMSALAQVLHGKGYEVQGSDLEKYFFTQKGLDEAGIKVFPFSKENIKAGYTVILGNAFADDHEEVLAAKELGLEVIRYPQFLGQLISHYTSIAITGSHGKTSTTGMLSHVLSHLDKASYLIGDGTGQGTADAKYFVLEACEYRRTFLNYHPDYAVMTNIDFDHPDYYKDIDDVVSAFQSFAHQVKKALVVCGDDKETPLIKAEVPIWRYGFKEDNDVVIKNLTKTTHGSSFDLYIKGEFYDHFNLPTFGTHNALNAAAVITITYLEGLESRAVEKQIESFKGVKRRFSEKFIHQTVVIDDYAHHPQEIRATLDAARQKYPERVITAIFQPHTFTRTIALLDDFAEALKLADHVFLCDIFASVRENAGNVKIEDLAEKIPGSRVLKLEDLSPLLNEKEDVCVFMGAGDVQKYEVAFEKLLRQQEENNR